MIRSLRLLARDRLTNTVIEVSQDGIMYYPCATLGPGIGDPDFINVTCISRTVGRYVRVRRLPGAYQARHINICEVQVYAYQYDGNYFQIHLYHTNLPISWVIRT